MCFQMMCLEDERFEMYKTVSGIRQGACLEALQVKRNSNTDRRF